MMLLGFMTREAFSMRWARASGLLRSVLVDADQRWQSGWFLMRGGVEGAEVVGEGAVMDAERC